MKQSINIQISSKLLDKLHSMKYILDYTDDGFVFNEMAGWVPAGDYLEYIIDMEIDRFEKENREERAKRRLSTQEEKSLPF